MPTCDTSWLLAFVDPHDPRHQDARATAEQVQTLTIPQAALHELLQVVVHRRRRMDGEQGAQLAARKTLAALEELPMVQFDQGPDAREIYRAHPEISFADAAILAAANEDPDGILTLDPRQEVCL